MQLSVTTWVIAVPRGIVPAKVPDYTGARRAAGVREIKQRSRRRSRHHGRVAERGHDV
jgi:hypothetical protein